MQRDQSCRIRTTSLPYRPGSSIGMNDVVAMLRAVAADPDAVACIELQRIIAAWIERQRRRTEVMVGGGTSHSLVDGRLTTTAP